MFYQTVMRLLSELALPVCQQLLSGTVLETPFAMLLHSWSLLRFWPSHDALQRLLHGLVRKSQQLLLQAVVGLAVLGLALFHEQEPHPILAQTKFCGCLCRRCIHTQADRACVTIGTPLRPC